MPPGDPPDAPKGAQLTETRARWGQSAGPSTHPYGSIGPRGRGAGPFEGPLALPPGSVPRWPRLPGARYRIILGSPSRAYSLRHAAFQMAPSPMVARRMAKWPRAGALEGSGCPPPDTGHQAVGRDTKPFSKPAQSPRRSGWVRSRPGDQGASARWGKAASEPSQDPRSRGTSQIGSEPRPFRPGPQSPGERALPPLEGFLPPAR
jgi:hypothetical protein